MPVDAYKALRRLGLATHIAFTHALKEGLVRRPQSDLDLARLSQAFCRHGWGHVKLQGQIGLAWALHPGLQLPQHVPVKAAACAFGRQRWRR